MVDSLAFSTLTPFCFILVVSFQASVKKYSGALATLCTWIWNVCEAAQPKLTEKYRKSQHSRAYQQEQQEQDEEQEQDHDQEDDALYEEVEDMDEGEHDQLDEHEADFGFVNGESVGSPQRLPAVSETDQGENQQEKNVWEAMASGAHTELDTNGDGNVDDDEIRALKEKHGEKNVWEAMASGAHNELDTNGDGNVDDDEIRALKEKRATS